MQWYTSRFLTQDWPSESCVGIRVAVNRSDNAPLPSKGGFPTGHGWCKASPMENLEGSGAGKAYGKACSTAPMCFGL